MENVHVVAREIGKEHKKSWEKVVVDMFDQYTFYKHRKLWKNENIVKF